MAEVPKIVLPHGGYRNLIVYRKSDVIYQGTVAFCRRFLPAHGDRTVDQMTQAARSCKQNGYLLVGVHDDGRLKRRCRYSEQEQGNGDKTHKCCASHA